ncbi:MAG: SAM-dependent methyltransferase, partial [Planctomycetota bacterium]
MEQAHLIDYYNAIEALLRSGRALVDDRRTHFGLLHPHELPPGYCFFAAIAAPSDNPLAMDQVRLGMDRLHERLFAPLGPGYAGRILDVGFGAGGTVERLAEEHPRARVVGINLNPKQHGIARHSLRRFENVELVLGDFLEHEFEEPFDLIYFIESAFHMADKRRLCQRICRALRPGGRVYVVDIFPAEDDASHGGRGDGGEPKAGI